MFGWLRNHLQRDQSMARMMDTRRRQLQNVSDQNFIAATRTQVSIDNHAFEAAQLRQVLAGTLSRLAEK